jgi:hypothetical protein
MLRSLVLCLLAATLVAGCSKGGTAGPKGPEASLVELNRAMQMWAMTKGSYPSDLSQLTNFPALHGKRLPTPPAGKKLAIDPATREVVFADQ